MRRTRTTSTPSSTSSAICSARPASIRTMARGCAPSSRSGCRILQEGEVVSTACRAGRGAAPGKFDETQILPRRWELIGRGGGYPGAPEIHDVRRPSMLTRSIVRIVGFCTRHAWAVIVLALVLAAGSGAYTARNFAINANIDDLMSSRLDWRKREIAYHNEFPQSMQLIWVVVDGPTPEATAAASRALTENLDKRNH